MTGNHALTELKRVSSDHPAVSISASRFREITSMFTFSLFFSFQKCQLFESPSKAKPAQKEFSESLSKQLDFFPSFSLKHSIYHLTTNYHFSHVTVACFTLCNLSLSTPNKSQQEHKLMVKPAYTLQSHNGVLPSFEFLKS